jgi:hypothetical protein
MKTKILFYFFLLSFTFCLLSCDTNDPPPPPPPVEEKVENTITVETVWQDLDALQVKFTKSKIDTHSVFRYYLYVNGKEEKMYTSISNETVHTDTGLTEGTEYRYSIKAYEEEELKDTSNILITSTLSTTSHDIEWKVDTLGVPGDYLRDVWGLDENNVWAVGALEVDGRGTNIIRWNGNKWNYFPISGEGWRNGIYGFDESNIWVVGGGTYGIVDHWDGSSWTHYDGEYFRNNVDTVWALNSIWGSSPEDIWAVGREGTIVHWDGEKWEKVISPVETNISDIWGNSPSNIYAVTSSISDNSKILHYDGIEWQILSENLPDDNKSFQSVWIDKNGKGFITGGDLALIEGSTVTAGPIDPSILQLRVRGSNSGNVYSVGQRGTIYHYNGSDWEYISAPNETNYNPYWLQGVYVVNSKVFIGGFRKTAIILRGTIK